MKIPFDIKYRPQIESGEYKVCNQSGNSARIICWDAINIVRPDCCIIALIKEKPDGDENNRWYDTKGYSVIGASRLFIITPEPELTPFEQHLLVYFQKVYYAHCESQDVNDFLIETIKQSSKSLLEFAKKELLGQWDEDMKNEYARGKKDGIAIGYNDAIKKYNESVSYPYPTYQPPCFYGGVCTNPFRDCINCPGHSSGTTINTSGTCNKD